MPLKAVLFDFNGIIINDEAIHRELIEALLLSENMRPDLTEFNQVCLGRSDRACLNDLLHRRGRVVTPSYLDKLIERKSQQYQVKLASLNRLPLYPGLDDLIFRFRGAQLKLALVTGSTQPDVDWVLQQAKLIDYFPVRVYGSMLPASASKPAPDGYLLAIDKLNEQYPGLALTPADCLVIEDSFAGIEAAKRAGIPVAGVAHTYPYHMIQRRATWAVDYLYELDLDWLQQRYATA